MFAFVAKWCSAPFLSGAISSPVGLQFLERSLLGLRRFKAFGMLNVVYNPDSDGAWDTFIAKKLQGFTVSEKMTLDIT